jgi:hypothetical protein
MHRCALLAFAVLGGCGGARSTTPQPPAGRAPELATVAGCSDATLRAFDPGVPGIERVAVTQAVRPEPPFVREHVRRCELMESDDLCQTRARRAVLATDPDAKIGAVSMRGEPDGWTAQLEVDGQRRDVRVAQQRDVIIEAQRLRSLGHQVTPVEGRVVYRPDGRSAVVSYEVHLPAASEPRRRWEARLHWPTPPELPTAIDRITREAERASLVVVRYEVTTDGISADVACP